MSSPILRLLDRIEKVVADLNKEIRKKSLRGTRVELEKLTTFSNCLKDLLPKEFVKVTFDDFDRHLHFIEVFIKKKDFEWMKSNLDDITREDLPNIKSKIYDLLNKEKLPERRAVQLSNRVFIVHGRDEKPIKELKAMLKEFGLKPIILHEQPSGSRTIVEKLEKYSEVGYAFVILTPDDILVPTALGYEMSKKEGVVREMHFLTHQLVPRARQNVILEFGYFMGLLGRDRVCCLYKGNVELPSDMHGIVYIPFKESVEECRDKIVKELKAAGYKI